MEHTVTTLLSVVPMRQEAAHRSEMVSQLLFCETAQALDTSGDFTRIRTHFDHYDGWVQTSQLKAVAEPLTPSLYLADVYGKIFVNGTPRLLPFGSPLPASAGETISIADETITIPPELSIWSRELQVFSEDGCRSIADTLTGTPYLWGGRSQYGIDCSGFVQLIYRLLGKPLLRDAYLQAEMGEEVDALESARCGDLAFFTNDAGKITHVGLLLDNKTIAHAAGEVRIDLVDNNGIIHAVSKKQTHKLYRIRRVGGCDGDGD